MENQENSQKTQENIVKKLIEEEMKSSYLDYSMSVIVGRALPDVRDGLKPVHRRILYAMQQMGMFHNKPFKKSARIVGEVLGKFHPHGDTAVYDSLVRMVQPFSLRYPLIRGQGNFGSVDGDRAAAMRYTEAKLSKLSEEMLKDIEKKTVKFVPNFDGSLKEPSFLPSKLPNLLVNGSSGIAVGMATNIPPHNLIEVADAAVHLIDNSDCGINELMQFVKGPDFPTAGIISGTKGIKNAYVTGKGRIIVKARYNIEEGKTTKRIIVSEIPYMVNKSQLLEEIADLVTDKKIIGISDIRDESDRKGMRIVIMLKKDANQDIVLNQLFKHTRLKVTFGVINLALVDGQPKILNLKDLIKNYVDHRRNVVRKRTKFDLNKAEDRAHILEGLIVALKDIDKTVKMIKESKSADEAKKVLISKLEISEKQSLAILDMRLQRLTGLEQEKIRKEHKELLELIEKLKAILADEKKILKIIKDELEELKKSYGDERRTDIVEEEEEEMIPEDLIKSENMVVTVTHSGYIKRLPVGTYKSQKRGGKGVIAAT
ncbi:DNA topoisomerase 4 subunit A, partial [Candidatus Woesearchaeota archaeon]|nr:DNA topoisomerase 4 subunit A [Candidatus Woesearchaeota archaeon]